MVLIHTKVQAIRQFGPKDWQQNALLMTWIFEGKTTGLLSIFM